MKIYKRSIALILVMGMMLTASCGKTAEETSAETTAAETEVTETTAVETTVETSETAEQTEASEETEAEELFSSFVGEEFDLNEYPFDISEDAFLSSCEQVGSNIYDDVDEFMNVFNNIRLASSNAIARYNEGIAVVSSDEAVEEMLTALADPTATNEEFNSHLTKIGIFTAADPYTQDYQIVVMYYEVDDASVLTEWFSGAAERFFEGAEATMPEGGGMELEINGYSNGDAGAVVSSYVVSAEEIQTQGYPEHTGAYIGFYVNGTSALYITVTDFDDDAHGIEMYQTFCDTMGIMDALPE